MDKFQPRCYSCALRRALCTAEKVSDDSWLQQKVIDESMRHLAEIEGALPPAEVIGDLLATVHEVLGTADPWKSDRESWVLEMTEALPNLRDRISSDTDPLKRALLISARTNVFSNEILHANAMREDLQKLGLRHAEQADTEFRHDDTASFQKSLKTAKRLVFVHDTAPEFPADLALLETIREQFPEISFTHVIKNTPLAMNDLSGLTVANGDLVPLGEVLESASRLGLSADDWTPEVGEALRRADVVICKGASHLQTLEASELKYFALLRAKCPVTASSHQCTIGDLLFIRVV